MTRFSTLAVIRTQGMFSFYHSATLDAHILHSPRIGDGFNTLVSRRHCEVYVVVYDEFVSNVYVRDRNTRNGTFVNKVRIGSGTGISPSHLLQDGDVIEIYPNWTMTFHDEQNLKASPRTGIQEMECKLFEEKYSISQRCLGSGAEGTVYLATEVETRKQLVCKIVDLSKLKGKNAPEDIRRRLQEADVLRQLQHPNVLCYVDAAVSPYSLYTFTELATGGDLWSFLYQRPCVGEFDTRVIVRQLAQALDYIHRKGVIHRDLKPENILLAYSPNVACPRILLSDFGACAVPRRSRMLTHAGTVNYQAPEILDDSGPHTASVDMWSLGIVTLTLLTHGMDVSLKGLDRMTQEEIRVFVEETTLCLERYSEFCRHFVMLCLRTAPIFRMTSTQARNHRWLRRPERHLQYFEKLERISRSNWKACDVLRPMPLQLPDVKKGHTRLDGLDNASQKDPSPEAEAADEGSQYFESVRSERDVASADTATVAGDKSSWDLSRPKTQTNKPQRLSPKQTTQPASVSDQKAVQQKLYPLIRRHTPAGEETDKRELIIEELKRANVKFLPDIPASSTTHGARTGKGEYSSPSRQKRQRQQ
ncbi:hypothetical protein CDD80_5748 [Ophiocordyceps camponoti-rufipedis]|uniref:Uncharacterized protein n=1 Tax=Ophiocordyceps camponoti-rufipedis TaxID=2004952 RepID=A0A2C5ZHY8_9HYPO|nr:hypothetical protein CDD80_5748 [Ophiocordyceps camponoti-rufipedis]